MTSCELITMLDGRRQEMNINRQDLAEEMGVHRNTVSRWLNMDAPMPLDMAVTMMHILKLDVRLVKVNTQ